MTKLKYVGNKSIEDGILKQRLNASKKFDIKATPTLYINGKKYEGDLTFEALKLKVYNLELKIVYSKKIKNFGFKSFAHPTEFLIEDGVTELLDPMVVVNLIFLKLLDG